MAKQQSGETKAPLVVALVVFVLLSLGLGVMTYMAFDKASAQEKAATEAKKDKDAAVAKLSEEQAKVLMYKVMLGTNSQEEFDNLRNGGKDQIAKQEYDAFRQSMVNRLNGVVTRESANFVGTGRQFTVTPDKVVRWTWTERLENPPETPIIDALVGSYAQSQLAAAKLETESRALEQAKQTYQDQFARAQKAEADFKALSAEFPKQVADVQKKADELVQATRDAFRGSTQQYTADMKAKVEALELEGIKLREALRKAEGLQNQLTRIEDRDSLKVDPFQYDRPHGRIIGKRGNIVDINLGSADNVRPGLTFSVQPADTPERGLQARMRPRVGPDGRPVTDNGRQLMDVHAKGTIEVVQVLGPNLSQARITSNPDPIREAILTGDVLYNPAWHKGAADRVALFGVFDVDADGTDDIKRVVQDLTRMGVVVDAYYDLATRKWVGQVTEQTTFAVEGYFPVQIGGDPLAGAKSELHEALLQARNEAKEKGVQVVKARNFFSRIGYNMRLDISNDAINRAYNRYLQTLSTGNAGEGSFQRN
jgi:hypothetical protein